MTAVAHAERDGGLAKQIALCNLLGIDPNRTTNVTVEWEAGRSRPVARWTGIHVLSADEVGRLGELLARPTPPARTVD